MYLIFDCSATRAPLSYDAPYSDSFNWPRLLHLSWILVDEDLKLKEDFNAIIKPSNFNVTDATLEPLHIKREDLENGEDLLDVLEQFNNTVKKASFGFSHNLKFNESIILSEYVRNKQNGELAALETYCLMQESTYYCQIPSRIGGYKWPSLQELHAKIFNHKYSPSNNARADVIASAKSFIALKKMRMLDDIFE